MASPSNSNSEHVHEERGEGRATERHWLERNLLYVVLRHPLLLLAISIGVTYLFVPYLQEERAEALRLNAERKDAVDRLCAETLVLLTHLRDLASVLPDSALREDYRAERQDRMYSDMLASSTRATLVVSDLLVKQSYLFDSEVVAQLLSTIAEELKGAKEGYERLRDFIRERGARNVATIEQFLEYEDSLSVLDEHISELYRELADINERRGWTRRAKDRVTGLDADQVASGEIASAATAPGVR